MTYRRVRRKPCAPETPDSSTTDSAPPDRKDDASNAYSSEAVAAESEKAVFFSLVEKNKDFFASLFATNDPFPGRSK